MLKYDFYVLVVVYKQQLTETQTFKTLMLSPNNILRRMKLIVWDNSPVDFKSEAIFDMEKFGGFIYFRAESNEKLSVLYNQVINNEFHGNGFFTILDQDTSIPANFFSEIEQAGVDDKLIVPRVVSNKTNSIISPRYQEYSKICYRAKVVKTFNNGDSGFFNSSNFFAVGSGLTLPRKIWDHNTFFEESLSFYGVDTEFCNRYSKNINEFYLLNVDFLHDASDYDIEESIDVKRWRHSKYIEYMDYVLRNNYKLPGFFIFLNLMLRWCFFKLKCFFLYRR
ncbi:MAG: hypothetical protein ACRDC6_21015 [Shewanella sp.]